MENLNFYILPGNPPPNFIFRELYDKAYDYYKEVWERILNRRIGPGAYCAYNMFRQDLICIITHENRIVAQSLSSFMNLKSKITEDLEYFQNFKGPALHMMLEKGAENIFSVEFSSIDRNYSPRKTNGLSFYELISQLGIRLGFNFDIDVIVGQPRRVTGTNDKVDSFGFHRVREGISKCGLTVDLMLGFRGATLELPNLSHRALVNKLWENRIDTTGLTFKTYNEYINGYYISENKHIEGVGNDIKQSFV